MEIIRPGFKEACGKIYLECSECGCGFVPGDEDNLHRVEDSIYTRWLINCPCCGEKTTVFQYEYDKLHANYIQQLRLLQG